MADLSQALYTEADIARMVQSLIRDYAPHMTRLRVRRLLMDAVREAYTDGSGTGASVPEPYNSSTIILKTILGDVPREVMRYVSRIAANDPIVSVVGTLAPGKREISATIDSHAAEQERLHQALWESVRGRERQHQIAWSQVWGRVGYYLTLPAPGWALPERQYYDDLSDDEIARMRRDGAVTPEPIEDGEGRLRYAEAGQSWIERRRAAARDHALNGGSLFTLEALPPDVVYKREDDQGIKWAAIVQDVPAEDTAPGGTYAMAAARTLGLDAAEARKLGILVDRQGNVTAGPTHGQEPSSTQSTWQLVRFLIGDEVYYLVSAGGQYAKGKIVWYDQLGDGCVPLVPVPYMRTDAWRPGSEYTSPIDPLMAIEPLVNQIVTYLSNVASTNANPRWVIEDVDGRLVEDPETGDPRTIGTAATPGLDPRDVQVTPGRLRQLVVDADLLLKMLEFYAQRMDAYKLPDVMGGNAGTSGPAWNTQMQIHSAQQDIQPAIDNHCDAVKQIHRIWIRRMRKFDEPVVMLSVPRHRQSARDERGLIEFDPKDLVEAIVVNQSAHTPTDRVALQQAGIELLKSNAIDDYQFFDEYMLEADPDTAVVRKYAGILVSYGLLGDVSVVQPGSLMAGWWEGMKGRLTLALLDRSLAYALGMAEQMTAAGQQQPAQNPGVPAGNVAESQGVRSPGMGMPLLPTGEPGGGRFTNMLGMQGASA